MSGWLRARAPSYTVVDFAFLGAVAVIAAIIFYATWTVYELGTTLLGPYLGVLVSYGLWYTGAILGAAIIRKPGAAILGETLGALLEAILPTPGGYTNLVYGVLQGGFSEVVYLALGYRVTPIASALAGAAAGIGALLANLILFRELVFEVSPEAGFVAVLLVAIMYSLSGALWGFIAHRVAVAVRR